MQVGCAARVRRCQALGARTVDPVVKVGEAFLQRFQFVAIRGGEVGGAFGVGVIGEVRPDHVQYASDQQLSHLARLTVHAQLVRAAQDLFEVFLFEFVRGDVLVFGLDPEEHHCLDRVFVHGASVLELKLSGVPAFIRNRIARAPRDVHVDQLPDEEPHARGDRILVEHGVPVRSWIDVWGSVLFKMLICSSNAKRTSILFRSNAECFN